MYEGLAQYAIDAFIAQIDCLHRRLSLLELSYVLTYILGSRYRYRTYAALGSTSLLNWIKAFSVCSDHCCGMGQGLWDVGREGGGRGQRSWEKWTPPGEAAPGCRSSLPVHKSTALAHSPDTTHPQI